MIVGILLNKAREKLDVSYTLAGLTADVSQLHRAYLKGNSKGKKKNIKQMIRKLEMISKMI